MKWKERLNGEGQRAQARLEKPGPLGSVSARPRRAAWPCVSA